MASLRESIRTTVPGSTAAYEWLQHARKRHRSKGAISQLASREEPLRLDIGSGGRHGKNGWITVDTVNGCDLYWDLREGIPFPDDSVASIYSSHLFEHLTYHDGQALMRECYRVLEPGGEFSIAVPDARIYVEGYLGIRDIPQEFFGWTPAFNGTTPIDALNYVAYMGGEHKYLFDQENLVHRLASAGFHHARAREFDPTLDLPERQYESIYAIGFKPVSAH